MNRFHDSETFENMRFSEQECSSDDFDSCTFRNCTFEESFLHNCQFIECRFYDSTVRNMTFKKCVLLNCEFYGCNLIGIIWEDFTEGEATGFASPVDRMEKCFCKFNQFTGINFTKFNFKQTQFVECTFMRSNCREADLSNCNLEGTVFTECELSKADFRNSHGWSIPLSSNSIKGAQFSFPEVVNLLQGLGIKWE